MVNRVYMGYNMYNIGYMGYNYDIIISGWWFETLIRCSVGHSHRYFVITVIIAGWWFGTLIRCSVRHSHRYFVITVIIAGWWFGTWILWLSIDWEFHQPNWRAHCSEGWLNHQPDIVLDTHIEDIMETMFFLGKKGIFEDMFFFGDIMMIYYV